MPTSNRQRWLFLTDGKLPQVFDRKPTILLSVYDRWRRTAKALSPSRDACLHLEWMIWYETKGGGDAYFTARHFGITPKTFYKWHNRFDPSNLRSLEEETRRPKTVRTRTYTPNQYERIVRLRKKYIRYSKFKLLHIYKREYPDDASISAWKIQCIIQVSGIYFHPTKQARINRKRCRSVKRKKITDLKRKKVRGFLLCLDTVVIYWNGSKRYIRTGIDRYSKIAFARMYTSHAAASSEDFLRRLHFLLHGKIQNVQTDNGSEFRGAFDAFCEKLNIPHYVSRVHTPKDNAVNERFNRTLQEEFIRLGNMTNDCDLFNKNLTEWLIEYNFLRPHQTLDYEPPMNFHYRNHNLLPMYPSSTCP